MFNWLKKKYAEYKVERDKRLALATAPKLHGVNLAVYEYLGRSEICFTYVDSEVKDSANVFLFAKKDDLNQRKYVIIPNSKYYQEKFDYHPWVTGLAATWKVGERELYDVVRDEPSVFLKKYMAETYNNIWYEKTKWWVEGETTKNRKKKTEKLTTEDNVVKVNFKKESDDVTVP